MYGCWGVEPAEVRAADPPAKERIAGQDDGALARTDVAFDVDDLLPGAQQQLAVADRHCQRRPQHGGLQVRMAVAVVPGLLMAVLSTGRKQAI